jgi:methylated-DNA-[protein]-cysteine S-methyltransferase
MSTWWRCPSRLGPVLLRARGEALSGLRFEVAFAESAASAAFDTPQLDATAPAVLREAARQLDEYLGARRRVFELPLHAEGSAFERSVWQALAGIGYGRRTSYAALAVELGLGAGHARAVARAVGANSLLVVVACHRVVGSDGALRGYAGGLERKRALLELEAAAGGQSWRPGQAAR